MNNDIKKVEPFDSFTAAYKILVWAGYYKPLNKPISRLKRISHQIYRLWVLLFSIIYNVQHLVFIVQHRYNLEKLMDSLMLEIPIMNMFSKVITMLTQSSRMDKMHELLKGPAFAAIDKQDEIILQKNKVEMHRLSKIMNCGVIMAIVLWPSSMFVLRYGDKNETVSSYMPFKTDTWVKFSVSVFLECSPILWTGFGHISTDCLIATYYAQAQTQLKIIKNQLQELLNENNDTNHVKRNFQYKDSTDNTVLASFIQIVKRYEKTVWYKNEVDAVFNFSMSIQFLSTGSAVCVVIYRMTIISIPSFRFLFLALLFWLLLMQVFLYCYYGNLVEFESRSVNDCLYSSDWLSLSPSFRRLLLIAMCRWSQPLKPRVSGIIPLSLNTFLSIVKSSYSLYTVLVVTAK